MALPSRRPAGRTPNPPPQLSALFLPRRSCKLLLWVVVQILPPPLPLLRRSLPPFLRQLLLPPPPPVSSSSVASAPIDTVAPSLSVDLDAVIAALGQMGLSVQVNPPTANPPSTGIPPTTVNATFAPASSATLPAAPPATNEIAGTSNAARASYNPYAPAPVEDLSHPGAIYVVTVGREVGIFTGWERVQPLVNKVSGGVSEPQGYPSTGPPSLQRSSRSRGATI
ncbi:hypothetical protein BKA70DRAFT_1440703 [Coprinopsis sp. MPI-PUGE-AT-0042]|nr:hypothetical protein BKA70DRAFT_1440703 [Coprinopsis sp. MPI-PUGE-AT-0042]